ncbi:trypsin-like peptidase domain-containing protein [Anabaena catenula]|uniref:Trypsin-like peptidase domain-containing protein n=1 Tax=Anabaena catenula FACHB-362 TaxID=2692877 RepID=A0ABR8JBM5_9NOST|nr:trypsin-like peptidase domain-containing protein [Anabaena catenula]MBD2694301.1 trypsin-like peptidase domain-containing protein [Anabaena catenula FACHB-362]
MRFGSILSSVLLTTTIVIFPLNGIAALSRQEVYLIAQKITVRIDGTQVGSGIIIKRKTNSQASTYTYTVLTNWHVVNLEGKYTAQIYNSRPNTPYTQYTFSHRQVKQLGDVDLAEFTFTSNQYYEVAEMGNSEQMTVGETIYVIGFPELAFGLTERKIHFGSGSISGPPQKPNKDGYTLSLEVAVIKGKSGGPILDANGKLVGIYGQSSRNINSRNTDGIALGIPLKTYLQLTGTRINPSPAVTKVPSRTTTKNPPQPVTKIPSPPVTKVPSVPFTLAKTLPGDFFLVTAIALSPKGEILASGSKNGSIELWNIATGSKIRTLQGHSDRIESLAFSPDGKTLASGSNDETIKLWNVATGTEIGSLQGSFFSVYSVTFSPNGKTLASGSSDGTIKLWDVFTTNERLTLAGHTTKVNAVAFSPDGRILASGSSDNTIKLWNIDTGTEIRTLTGHSNRVNSVAFSLKERILASGSDDNTIKLWNIDTGTEIRTLTGHSNRVNSVAFSPEGRILASGSDDNTIKLWNVATGTQIHTLTGYADTVDSVIFSLDGKTLASASRESNIKVWRVSK